MVDFLFAMQHLVVQSVAKDTFSPHFLQRVKPAAGALHLDERDVARHKDDAIRHAATSGARELERYAAKLGNTGDESPFVDRFEPLPHPVDLFVVVC